MSASTVIFLLLLFFFVASTQSWWLVIYVSLLIWLVRLADLKGWKLTAVVAATWLAVAAVTYWLPDSAAARFIAWDPRSLLTIFIFGSMLYGFLRVMRLLDKHAVTLPETGPGLIPADPGAGRGSGLSNAELDRYARHLVLREIGGPGQMKLRQAKVLVVGAGGLGSPVCLYLAAAGVGQITVIDGDRVSISNLQRQVIFREFQRGETKAGAAAENMSDLNRHIRVNPISRMIAETDLPLIAEQDLVLDGTDNFATRDLVNRLCVKAGVPLLSGSIAQWEGQVTLYDPARGAPCLACIFPEPPAPGLAPACAEAGVVGPLPGVVGSMMALEAIKHLSGAGQGLAGRMLLFDGLYGETRMIGMSRRADCPVCGSALEAPAKAT